MYKKVYNSVEFVITATNWYTKPSENVKSALELMPSKTLIKLLPHGDISKFN